MAANVAHRGAKHAAVFKRFEVGTASAGDEAAMLSTRFSLFALLFTAEEGPGHVNAPSKLQDDIVPPNLSQHDAIHDGTG